MKKPAVKTTTTKALTPAKKTAKPAVSKTPPAPAAKAAPAKATAPAKAAASAKAAAPTPKAKAVAPKAVVTTIIANFDVGFGRSLHIRGEGPGLSWDQGLLMECVGPDQWKITLAGESVRPVVFKFLIDDETWSAAEDYIIATGESLTATPVF